MASSWKNHSKFRQVALSYKNMKNLYKNSDISTIEAPPGVSGVSKILIDITEHYFDKLEC